MKTVLTINQVLFSGIGGLIGTHFGELEGIFYVLLTFIVIDYLTGVFAAIIEKDLASQIGFKGIVKKISILFLVAIGHLIDTQVLKHSGAVETMIIFFYLSNEGLSILENIIRIGLPVPEELKAILKQFHDKGDKNNG